MARKKKTSTPTESHRTLMTPEMMNAAPVARTVNGVQFWCYAGMTLGVVPLDRLRRRRANYKDMTAAQEKALAANLDKFGMQGFCPVAPNPDGVGFDVIDGHHRWEEFVRRGAVGLQCVLIEGLGTDDLDLGMFGFNVTGEPVPDVYLEFVRDLTQRVGPDLVGEFGGIDPEFLRGLEVAIEHPLADQPGVPDEVTEAGPARAVQPIPAGRVVVLREQQGTVVHAYKVPTDFVLSDAAATQIAALGFDQDVLDLVECDDENALRVALLELE